MIDAMEFRIDLHVHSKYSGDNGADPEETVLKALEAGLDGIAFTEHYSYGASEPVETLREKYGGEILILRGVEFSTLEGHCLVFGVDTDRFGFRYPPVSELIRAVTERGGVVVPSHPYRVGNSLGDAIRQVPGITAVEGHNGCNMRQYNELAVAAAQALRLPYTGGSDAHEPSEVGLCYTAFKDRVTAENLVAALKTGAYRGVDTRGHAAAFSAR